MALRRLAGWGVRGLALGAAGVALLGASGAEAQEPARVAVQVMVSHIRDVQGAIDPRGQKLHSQLKKQFRYGSLDVVESRELALALDEVGRLDLPNGRPLRIRPLDLDDRKGVLLAVSVEGTVEVDLRIRNGRRAVIGGDRYRDGRLVVSLQPRW